MIAVAVDPGLRGCGLAVFESRPVVYEASAGLDTTPFELMHASYVLNPARHGFEFEAAREMADMLRRSVEAVLPTSINPRRFGYYAVDQFFGECPVSYTAGSQKGSQNDLIHLAGFIYAIACLPLFSDASLKFYEPRQWKGTIEKGTAQVDKSSGEITSDGMQARIMGRLSPAEVAKITRAGALTHNVIDAIGIGLKGLDRLEPRRVYGVL